MDYRPTAGLCTGVGPFAAVKRAFRHIRYRLLGVGVDVRLPLEVHGIDTGAWLLTPGELGPESIVYSFGIGRDITFELSLVKRFGCRVHCFDPTPASIEWVRNRQPPSAIVLHEYGLGASDGMLAYHPPRRSGSTHYTPVPRYKKDRGEVREAPVRRLSTIMAELGHDHVDLMKLDIEGGEYDAIDDLVKGRPVVRQLLVEFHHCYETIPLASTVRAVHSLHTAGYRIFSISPRTYEISFIRAHR